MKSLWTGQPDKLKIRSTCGRPEVHEALSGIVILYASNKSTNTYKIKFDDDVVEFLSKHLPYGVSKIHPVCFKVKEFRGLYGVFASYMMDKRDVLLWVSREKPTWCKH